MAKTYYYSLVSGEKRQISEKNKKAAREYFNIVGQSDLVLHHKDADMLRTDVDRYIQWRPEDLMVLTIAEHMSLHQKGAKRDAESIEAQSVAHTYPVMCVETNVVYRNSKEAQRETGIDHAHISAVCKGNTNRKTAGGFHWIRLESEVA